MPAPKKISAGELNRLRLLFDKYRNGEDKIHYDKLAELLKAEGRKDPQKDVCSSSRSSSPLPPSSPRSLSPVPPSPRLSSSSSPDILRSSIDHLKSSGDQLRSSPDLLRRRNSLLLNSQVLIKELEAVSTDGFITFPEFVRAFVSLGDDKEETKEETKEELHSSAEEISSPKSPKHTLHTTITFNAPLNVEQVKVAGPFNNWQGELMDAAESHSFTKVLSLDPGHVQFKFILKIGEEWKWDVDYTKPTETTSGHVNNWIEVPVPPHA